MFKKISKITAIFLGIAAYAVLHLLGANLNVTHPGHTWVFYTAMLMPIVVLAFFILNFRCFTAGKKPKKSKLSASDEYQQSLRARELACNDYARASADARLRIFFLYALNTVFVLLNIAYAVAQGYSGMFDIFTVYILYDAAKRLMPISYGVRGVPLLRKDAPQLYELADKCAKQARCQKPSIYIAPTSDISYTSGVLVIGVHILPFLTQTQLCSLICQSMFLSKSLSQKISKMHFKRREVQSRMSALIPIGSEFHKTVLDGVKNKMQLPYGEELIADRKAAKYYPNDLPKALTVSYALDEFFTSSPKHTETVYLYEPNRSCEAFISHISERAERNECILKSEVEYMYASIPNLSVRMKNLAYSDITVTLPDASEVIPCLNDIYEAFKKIYLHPVYKYFKKQEEDELLANQNIIDRYERDGGADHTDAHKLTEIIDAYCDLGKTDEAKKILDDILASADEEKHPMFLCQYGRILLSEEDSDGIGMIMQAIEEDPDLYGAYRDICDFASKFSLDNVFNRTYPLYLQAIDRNTRRNAEIFEVDSQTELFPTTLDSDTVEQITAAINRICGEKLIEMYIVRRKTSERDDMNLVLINWGISGNEEMYRRIFSYLDARDEHFALLIAEDNPMYAYLFLKKVPDSRVYRKH